MYNAFFGFTQNPFNMSPDPSFLFRSPQHEEALANLIYGVQSRKGFIVLAGEVGTGKTTMLECLRDFLNSQQIAFASLFNSRLTVEQFFEMLAYDLDLRCNRLSKSEVLLSLNNMLLERAAAGRTTVLIIDEAHNLEWDVLEEVRLLGNLENRRGKMLQIILAGQQELDRKMDAPEFRQLKQRIALRCTLRGFNLPESVAYVHSRMARAGLKVQTIFSGELLKEIHVRAQGIPRLINAICDNLLLTAFALESKTATPGMLDEVTSDMRLEYPGQRTFHPDTQYSDGAIRQSRVPFRVE
ncbi:General secretion pathway protein-related protein [Candidatus Sulfopaludibacter sp. SbA4]|nr:General secretion pathway protein-related protein [Candidatus Sulfopaludibacter sp. SbA4]